MFHVRRVYEQSSFSHCQSRGNYSYFNFEMTIAFYDIHRIYKFFDLLFHFNCLVRRCFAYLYSRRQKLRPVIQDRIYTRETSRGTLEYTAEYYISRRTIQRWMAEVNPRVTETGRWWSRESFLCTISPLCRFIVLRNLQYFFMMMHLVIEEESLFDISSRSLRLLRTSRDDR